MKTFVLDLDRVAGFAPRPAVVLLVEDAAADDLRHYHRLGADHAFAISSGFEAFLAGPSS